MILQFAKEINRKPTYFVEKIWESILRNGVECNLNDLTKYLKKFSEVANYVVGTHKAKIHSIRTDESNRWEEGKKIHCKQWSGRPYHSKNMQFAPEFDCVSTQEINFYWYKGSFLRDGYEQKCVILLDGKTLTATFNHCQINFLSTEIEQLAFNDGFDSVKDFFKYFDKNFEGKIIHWTDFKY